MAARFQTDLVVKELDGELHELQFPFVYEHSDGRIFTIPSGFVTDYASIPFFMRWRFPKSGPWKWAAVVHDFLYQHNGVTRAYADSVLKEGMKAKKVRWRTRNMIYLGVRVGGWLVWNRYRKQEQR